MTVSAVNPWRMAFREARCFPFSLFGSVLFIAFAEVGLESVGRRSCWEAPDLASFRNSPACVSCGDRSERLNRNGRGRRHDIRLVGPPGSGAGGFRSKARARCQWRPRWHSSTNWTQPRRGAARSANDGHRRADFRRSGRAVWRQIAGIFYRAGDEAPEW
jgi:hypothetical protein